MMADLYDRCLKKLRLWRAAEDGSVTIEYVLWIPVIFFIFGMTVDATMLMQKQSQFFIAARDASRQVAVGALSDAEAESQLASRFAEVGGLSARVTTTGDFVTSSISAPFSAFTLFADALKDGTLVAEVSMLVETDGT
ncbi:TadE/TadG family type IV pilus assembly protein [Pseudoroseicyclus sp. CXY001]|uniref:TadE/TadG family type IV pilus assembly protein n=1 Tax=Pseudoroseicyclus sp. CXY001 TaxID=3242492 RepID=UPI0035714422